MLNNYKKDEYYKICKRCVMDTSAKDIKFNNDSVCNFCSNFLDSYKFSKNLRIVDKSKLDKLISACKERGKGRKYDCIVGVSGGVDSSFTLIEVVNKGLNPLAVHMDNGWDSELAQNNIQNLVRKLNVDLFTYVIEWQEYRSLMQSFFDADVVDIEILYDNAAFASCYNQAKKNGLKHILAGTNIVTEGMAMPKEWNWLKYDKKNIESIAKLNNIKINSFPCISLLEKIFYENVRGIRWISFLDFLEFDKDKALKILIKEFGYKPYPYKHYESIFTRFYQGYILPKKFGIDKRRVHFSNLISTGLMKRNEAIELLKNIPYPSIEDLEEDKAYFLKKMKWEEATLDEYISRPPKSHYSYPTDKHLYDMLYQFAEKIGIKKMKKFIKGEFQYY